MRTRSIALPAAIPVALHSDHRRILWVSGAVAVALGFWYLA